MRRALLLSVFVAMLCTAVPSMAMDESSHVFGYFQTQFWLNDDRNGTTSDYNSFNLQQLNLFWRQDFNRRWTAFVNIESVNTYSSQRGWGEINLEEAWVSYRMSEKWNFKLGLQIPPFNSFNEIRDKMPLIPYIIRPLVYESSLTTSTDTGDFLPERAFAQVYGFHRLGRWKIDKALYIGDTQDINAEPFLGQTGIDTTMAILVGARVGVRRDEFKAGFSITADQTDQLQGLEALAGGTAERFEALSRIRIGGDLRFRVGNVSVSGEYLGQFVYEDEPNLDVGRHFYYATAGYHFDERWFLYLSYWVLNQKANGEINSTLIRPLPFEYRIPVGGFSAKANDRVTFKGQLIHANSESDSILIREDSFFVYTLAVSVLF